MKRFIGDSVMAARMLDAVEEKFPPLTIICAPPVSQVLQNPTRERVFLPLDTRRKPWDVMRSAMALRKRKFGIAILVNHSFRSALTVRLAGIPVRIGHATEGRTWLLTNPVPYSEDEFEAWSNNDLAKPLGIDVPRQFPKLPIRPEEIDRGRALAGGGTVGIQPGARFPEKMLPIDTMEQVCRKLQKDGRSLVFLGASEEKEASSDLQGRLSQPVIDLVGKTSIRDTLGVLSNLDLMIGADTGLMHMAVASGCTTVTAFGPTPAQKWGHRYEPHQVLLAPEGRMDRLEPEELYAAASKILDT